MPSSAELYQKGITCSGKKYQYIVCIYTKEEKRTIDSKEVDENVPNIIF